MSKKKEEPRENVIWLMDIFYEEYNFKELFPEKHGQYIRSFHEFLRRGENNGTVPKRKDKRWCWDVGENLDEVHRLLKERYPEVEGKEVARAKNKRVIHPKYKSGSSETRSNRATPKTPGPTSSPATPCLSSPAATPKDASPEPDKSAGTEENKKSTSTEENKKPTSTEESKKIETEPAGTEDTKTPQKPAQTKNRLSVPKAKVKTSAPKRTKCEPEKDLWFPLDRSEIIKELVLIGQSVRSIAYICDMNADEVKTLIKEASPTIMGIIPE